MEAAQGGVWAGLGSFRVRDLRHGDWKLCVSVFSSSEFWRFGSWLSDRCTYCGWLGRQVDGLAWPRLCEIGFRGVQAIDSDLCSIGLA